MMMGMDDICECWNLWLEHDEPEYKYCVNRIASRNGNWRRDYVRTGNKHHVDGEH